MRENVIRLTESELRDMITEEVRRSVMTEAADHSRLIRELFLDGEICNIKNEEGYYIGTGYGRGTRKEFFYPSSESMEHSYCFVETDEINRVVEQMEEEGYEFERDRGYVYLKGKRSMGSFTPSPANQRPRPAKKQSVANPRTDPVGYYSDRVFTTSNNGNLHLF